MTTYPTIAGAARIAAIMLVVGISPADVRGADEPTATPEQLRALYVGQWKLVCNWTNDVTHLSTRAGETMGGYTGTAQISERDGQLVMEIVGEAPSGMRWEKQLTLAADLYRLALDAKKIRRRTNLTEYTRLDLMLSPDRTMLRGVAFWNNGLNERRSNESQLLQAQSPSSYFPWGAGGSSLCLTRVGPPPESTLLRPVPVPGPTLLLESLDPDSLAEADDLHSTLSELAQWLTALGYDVHREKGGTRPDLYGLLEVGRFQANISGQETYLDVVSKQPVKFLKGTITVGAAFTIKDGKGKRPLLRVEMQRARESATPDDDPKIRVTPRGTILLSPNMPQDLKHVLDLLAGQAAALPAKQRRSPYVSRLEELLHKGE